jgi:hypothetical protein
LVPAAGHDHLVQIIRWQAGAKGRRADEAQQREGGAPENPAHVSAPRNRGC